MEVEHHDGLFGEFDGPVGNSFGTALANQAHGLNNMQALVAPNLAPPIRTMMVTKVRTDNMLRVVQFWGAAQQAVGNAVTDCYEHHFFPKGIELTHGYVQGVFVHPFAGLGEGNKPLEGKALAAHMHALYCLCYIATVGTLFDAITGGLTPDERIERAKKTNHPFVGFKWDDPNEPAPAAA
jgi:formaldehyde-activating enzyme